MAKIVTKKVSIDLFVRVDETEWSKLRPEDKLLALEDHIVENFPDYIGRAELYCIDEITALEAG